jgi:hypothetical protein
MIYSLTSLLQTRRVSQLFEMLKKAVHMKNLFIAIQISIHNTIKRLIKFSFLLLKSNSIIIQLIVFNLSSQSRDQLICIHALCMLD